MSKCNNAERKWPAAATTRAQGLAKKAKGIALNEKAPSQPGSGKRRVGEKGWGRMVDTGVAA